jgi:hypothetical protein
METFLCTITNHAKKGYKKYLDFKSENTSSTYFQKQQRLAKNDFK